MTRVCTVHIFDNKMCWHATYDKSNGQRLPNSKNRRLVTVSISIQKLFIFSSSAEGPKCSYLISLCHKKQFLWCVHKGCKIGACLIFWRHLIYEILANIYKAKWFKVASVTHMLLPLKHSFWGLILSLTVNESVKRYMFQFFIKLHVFVAMQWWDSTWIK